MSLFEKINEDLKNAMKMKDQISLRGIRAIKSGLLLLKTDASGKDITLEDELKLLQKLANQRKESIELYTNQGREDLAILEKEELDVISKYLPEQLSEDNLRIQIKNIIDEVGATSVKDIGKIMPLAIKKFAGRADGKLISQITKEILE